MRRIPEHFDQQVLVVFVLGMVEDQSAFVPVSAVVDPPNGWRIRHVNARNFLQHGHVTTARSKNDGRHAANRNPGQDSPKTCDIKQ